jgi:CRISPR-associated protein Cas6
MIDLVFGVRGSRMPSDYRFALWSALRNSLPWVDQEAAAGIVGIRLTQTGEATALLARRAKLTLRVPANRVAVAQQLEGMRIDFGSDSIEIAFAYCRALVPAATIYAQLVVLGFEDETAFGQALAKELADYSVTARYILGRRKSLRAGSRELVGYPVALHECSAEQSMRVLQSGLGAERGLGCGIFVPHKKIGAIE